MEIYGVELAILSTRNGRIEIQFDANSFLMTKMLKLI